MSISPARRIAFDALRRVEAEGAYASDLLHAELTADISPKDAALATELTLGVLRWRRLLDFLLDRWLKKPVAKLDLPVALALRLGLYQLRFLERIPPRAAVNESVELVKRARKSSAASLVNAILRRLGQDAEGASFKPARLEAELPPGLSPSDRLAILHSHPTWLVERWLARLGEAPTLALLDANNRAPRLSCTLHDPAHRDEILRVLEKSGLRVEPGALLRNAFAISGGSPIRTDAFRRGAISVQDEASQIIPLLLDVHAGDRVLDLCAAPGGKTPPLVRAAGDTGLVVAADRHAHRLRAMRAQFERLHLDRIHLLELEAEHPLPFRAQFDRILVDAPCSGTGTLARHPEIRWRLKPEQLAEFHRLQVAILRSALDALAPGGRLVYSTCSLEPEENEDVIAEVLAASPSGGRSFGSDNKPASSSSGASAFSASRSASDREAPEVSIGIRRLPATEAAAILAPHLASAVDAASLFDSSGYFRTLPGPQATDGFFAAILEKAKP
ncbi:MAG TPA: 16S rRNA (cytosine(967)-C(5))-methyltransferase RsmB [Candidatus Acidoferrum sp.]|nr:16S rRNA (cytosine(967)-C(5))-methyltransferase RsmB [Candidatus Acidoferrum sp.]